MSEDAQCDPRQGITLGDKLRFEWPVMLVIVAGMLWLSTMLGDIKSLLVGLDARVRNIETLVPALQNQVSTQGDRINGLGERMTRIEAGQPK